MEPWSDVNRFIQNGYSNPTLWPCVGNYTDRTGYLEDYQKALDREASRTEWLWEQEQEAREEWEEYRAEVKAEREDY